MRIGIGITTYNRYEVFKHSYHEIKKYLPKGAKLVVVDDCSDIPVKEATFRFSENVGIAAAKNKCFELLEGSDYIFLFDDDTYPINEGWHFPYISSGLNHAMMIWDKLASGVSTNNKLLKKIGGLHYYKNPCGCLLFYTKKCLDLVGGMDTGFGQWGGEHQDLSQRIYNNGLIPYPFIDIANSRDYFYAHDYYVSCERSVPSHVRKKSVPVVMRKLQQGKTSKEFIPYREMTGRIISTYFTGVEDPQRGKKWEPNYNDFAGLLTSAAGVPVSILCDCKSLLLDLNSTITPNGHKLYGADIIPTECKVNPYLQRWISILEYLKEVKEDYVFCVDATDVQMINNPFVENMGNYLWVGDEPSTIRNEWLIKHHNVPLFKDFFRRYAGMPLLNAGVIGGRKCVIEAFLKRMVWFIQNEDIGFSDMGLFNYLLYTEFKEKIRHGRKVTNVFKSYKITGKEWFSHK